MTGPPPTSPLRGPLAWTLRLPAAPAIVMAALAVVRRDVQVAAHEPARLLLVCRGDDPALYVAVELHPCVDGTELVARDAGRHASGDSVKMTLLTGFVLAMSLAVPPELPLKHLLLAACMPSLMYLLAAWVDVRRRRRAEFMRVLQAVDRAVAPLRTRDERPYRALARPPRR